MVGWTAALGGILSVTLGGIAAAVWGRHEALAAVGFGLGATVLQLAAVGILLPVLRQSWEKFSRRWLIGMGLRMVGVAVFAVLAWIDPSRFPPLASALGLLGVMVPLLFFEARLLR